MEQKNDEKVYRGDQKYYLCFSKKDSMNSLLL